MYLLSFTVPPMLALHSVVKTVLDLWSEYGGDMNQGTPGMKCYGDHIYSCCYTGEMFICH